MLDQTNVHDRLVSLRTRAAFFVAMRRKDVALYDVIADCLAVCEDCLRNGTVSDMRNIATSQAALDGRNRSYFESSADIYLIIGRHVFEGTDKRRDAAWRYTATMREAAKAGIASTDLAKWLRENGGINALFRSRTVQSRTSRTKTLHLSSQIEVPKDAPFTITLQRRSDGVFDVIP
jgi:hypothetical protein